MPKSAKKRSTKELRAMVAEWQRRLRLQDYNVRVRWADSKKIIKRGLEAQVSQYVTLKEARIEFLHPDDYPKTADLPQNLECVVVHELLHLHVRQFFDHNRAPASHLIVPMEQAVELIAQALVNAKRGKS